MPDTEVDIGRVALRAPSRSFSPPEPNLRRRNCRGEGDEGRGRTRRDAVKRFTKMAPPVKMGPGELARPRSLCGCLARNSSAEKPLIDVRWPALYAHTVGTESMLTSTLDHSRAVPGTGPEKNINTKERLATSRGMLEKSCHTGAINKRRFTDWRALKGRLLKFQRVLEMGFSVRGILFGGAVCVRVFYWKDPRRSRPPRIAYEIGAARVLPLEDGRRRSCKLPETPNRK